jgi:parvulin-like peptidyl-prolyl isomerase
MIRRTLVAALSVLVFHITACDPLQPSQDPFAIRVGDTGITLETVRRDVEVMSEQLGLSKEEIGPVLDHLIERLVEKYLILAYGRDQGITLKESEVDAVVDNIKSDYPSEAAFRDMLLKRYVDFDVWEEQLREQMMIQKILAKAMEDVEPVTSQEIQREYESRVDSFRHPAMVRFRQMVTRSRDEARKIIKTVQQGTSLAALIQDKPEPFEQAVGMRERWATQDELEATLAKAVFALPPGLAGEPVKTPYGYHVVEVIDRRPEGVMTLPEVIGEIETLLSAEKQEAFYQEWIQNLRTRYPVKVDRGVLKTLEIE